MTDDDRHAMLLAMYQDEDGGAPVDPGRAAVVAPAIGKRRSIKVGAIAYEVSSADYVESLEQRIASQQAQLDLQAQQLKQVGVAVALLRSQMRRDGQKMRTMSSDLDRKIDRRGDH